MRESKINMGGEKLRISKKTAAIFAFIFAFSIGIHSQVNTSSVPESNGGNMEQGARIEVPSDDVPFSFSNQAADEHSNRGSTFFLFVRMLLVLAFVVACIYGVMWLMKRSMKTNPRNSDPFLRNVSSIDLAVGKSVHVVTLLDHAYVVGVSDDSVNLIGTLNSENDKDRELINAMNLYADEHQNVRKPKSFSDVLEIFMPSGVKEKGGIFGDAQKKMKKNMETQRNKLNGGE